MLVFFLNLKIRYLQVKHVSKNFFFVLVDWVDKFRRRLFNLLERFDVGNVLEVKGKVFLIKRFVSFVGNHVVDMGDVLAENSPFWSLNQVHDDSLCKKCLTNFGNIY